MIATSNVCKSTESAETAMSVGVPRDLLQNEEDWEFQLDLLGTHATLEQLQAHLDAAPNPDSATAQFLMGYLSHASQASA
jgi:hypothetical protein